MYGTSRRTIIAQLGQTLRTVREPVLIGQFAFDPQYAQPLFDADKANQILDSAGWVKHADGIRYKDKRILTFRLYAEDTSDNRIVTKELKKEWKALGVKAEITLQPSIYFQSTLQYRGYDAVLHGISIGNDPDVYAYWHSSQADGNGMNFSNYKSSVADNSLEAGRTRQNATQRNIKYKPFLKAWSEDVPAIPLYRPKFYYATHGKVYGLNEHIMNTDADRYYSADQWMVKTAMTDDK
jgi:peptide/nickel transport system substrate-binding protein